MTRPLVEKLFFAALGIFLLAVFACIGVYLVLSRDLPQLPDTLEKINLSLPTEIYSVDGERIAVLGERRPVPIEDISPDFLKAIIAVEDANFYRHKGVDHLALFRAMF
ncbi:MAG: transglycosylase domain-containing protein, partial [Nitrospinae bacterium]|nr:transglycosylase domain-containing protein [Nitrospinota bacterium]